VSALRKSRSVKRDSLARLHKQMTSSKTMQSREKQHASDKEEWVWQWCKSRQCSKTNPVGMPAICIAAESGPRPCHCPDNRFGVRFGISPAEFN